MELSFLEIQNYLVYQEAININVVNLMCDSLLLSIISIFIKILTIDSIQ